MGRHQKYLSGESGMASPRILKGQWRGRCCLRCGVPEKFRRSLGFAGTEASPPLGDALSQCSRSAYFAGGLNVDAYPDNNVTYLDIPISAIPAKVYPCRF